MFVIFVNCDAYYVNETKQACFLAQFNRQFRFGMALNAVMLIIAAITLFFVIFPEKTTVIADFLRLIYHYFTNAFK